MKSFYVVICTIFAVFFTAVLGPKIYKDFVYSHNEPKVFYVEVVSPTTNGHGTGFHVKNSKGKVFLVTNKHVCGFSPAATVTIYKNEEEFLSRVIRLSKTKDLCALDPVPDAKVYNLNHRLYVNEPVTSVGYPSNYPLYVSEGDIVGGINYRVPVAADSKEECEKNNGEWSTIPILTISINHCTLNNKVIVTSVQVRPGNSGGPLVDFFGNAVGMVTSVDQFGWGMAIPAKDIEDFLEEIE